MGVDVSASLVLTVAVLTPAVIFAGFVRGLTGFGGPLILVPVFVVVFEPAAGAAIVLIIDLASNFGLLPDAVRRMSKRTVLITSLGAAVTVPFGTMVMISADPAIVRDIIYVAVAGAALILLTGFRFPRGLRPYELFGGGALAGGVMGATSLGIVIVPFLFSMPDSTPTNRANIIVWAFLLGLYLVATLALKDVVDGQVLLLSAIFAPIYLVGVIVGRRAFSKIDEAAFRRGVLIFLFLIAGVGLLLN